MTEVWMTVKGSQTDCQGEKNIIEFQTGGRYFHKQGMDCFTYRETEISGMEGTTTLLKIKDGQIILVRMGSVEMKHIYQLNCYSESVYVTPYGTLVMGVLTSKIDIMLENGIGQISVEYELSIDGKLQSRNTLDIITREA